MDHFLACDSLLLLLLSNACGGAMSHEVPVVVPTYVGFTPKIDGKVSDQVWASAQKVGNFMLVKSGELATQQTEVRICYDRTHLYVGFECYEDKMDEIVMRHTDDNAPVWQDDSVELFISPYSVASTPKCHQFVVNAAGAKAYLRPDWVRPKESWRAAALRMKDRWIAEIAIPFDTLRPWGRNEKFWRINFCRNEHPHGEVSSWSAVDKWFATHSRFGKMIPPVAPFSFTTFRADITPVTTSISASTGIRPVDGEVKHLRSAECIIPEPQEMHKRISKSPFIIRPDTRIVINDDAAETDLWTIGEINAAIERLGGPKLETVRTKDIGIDINISNAIIIGESARNGLLRAICEHDEVRMPRSRFGTGTHVIDILPDRAVIVGSTLVDTYYGAQTLKQVLKVNVEGSVYIPALSIRDYARFQYRGVHLLTSRDALPYIGKLIENVLAPLKINNIVLQTDKVAWESHPEIIDESNFMPREDVKKLIEIAKRHHITVTPLVQSPGHLEWAYRNKMHLDIAEDPEHPYSYCMSNPKSYEFIFSVIDEAIKLFGNPEYFHTGRDECDLFEKVALDDQCKALGKERLYFEDTMRIYDHLRSKGCKMMMWGDVFSKPGFLDYVDQLPKDILICDWRYSPAESYPSIDFYQAHGFRTLACTWYDPRNISTFASYAARRGIQGMLQTTWTGWKTEAETLRDHPNQVYAYLVAAGWFWNPVRPNPDDLPYRPDAMFHKFWRNDSPIERSRFYTVELEKYCNISRIDSGRTPGWLGIGRGNDLRGLPDGFVGMEGVTYKILSARLEDPSAILLGGAEILTGFPSRVDGIEVGTKASTLHFLHGCAYSADDGVHVASYIIHYEDGQTEEIPLNYMRNIYSWDDQHLGMSYGAAWRGKAQDGRGIGLSDLQWDNPRPEVAIASIDFVGENTDASPFLVAITAEE